MYALSRITILCITLPLVFTVALADGLSGSPLRLSEDEAVSSKPAVLTDEDGTWPLGDDGISAWFWPGLDQTATSYRSDIEIPADCVLRSLRVTAMGSGGGDPVELHLRDVDGAVLLHLTGLVLGANGLPEDVGADSLEVALSAGSILRIELSKEDGSRAPHPTADNDCRSGNLSYLRSTGLTGGQWQALEGHDFNFRALVEFPAGDPLPPLLHLPADGFFPRNSWELPLSVTAIDQSGVDSVWVVLDDPEPLETGLRRIGNAGSQRPGITRVPELWEGTLSFAGVEFGAEQRLGGWIHALDSLGNEATEPFEYRPVEETAWVSGSGRGDESYYPIWPPLPGAAVAVRVPVAEFAGENSLQNAVVTGGSVRVKGSGSVELLMARDGGSQPAVAADTLAWPWVPLTDPDTLTLEEECGPWLDFEFSVSEDDSLWEEEAVWLILRFLGTGPGTSPSIHALVDWRADSLASTALATSWSYDTYEQRWSPLADLDLLIRARVEAELCQFELPLFADFDSDTGYADLRCWNRENHLSPEGWQLDAEFEALSAAFKPLDALWDPDSLQEGSFAYVNSDRQGLPFGPEYDVCADTLATPWLEVADEFTLEFLSLYGDLAWGDHEEHASVLYRYDFGAGSIGNWELLASGADFWAVVADTTVDLDPDTPLEEHGVWVPLSFDVAVAAGAVYAQLAFAYESDWNFGWAIDDVRISPPAPPGSSPWDGPPSRQAELGRIYPNPFNPLTRIPYRVREAGSLRITVHNLLGQQVALLLDRPRHPEGEYHVTFEPGALASGIYFVRLRSAGDQDVRRVLYLR